MTELEVLQAIAQDLSIIGWGVIALVAVNVLGIIYNK